jgi:hypothetical protein
VPFCRRSCSAKAVRLLDILGDMENDPIKREEEVSKLLGRRDDPVPIPIRIKSEAKAAEPMGTHSPPLPAPKPRLSVGSDDGRALASAANENKEGRRPSNDGELINRRRAGRRTESPVAEPPAQPEPPRREPRRSSSGNLPPPAYTPPRLSPQPPQPLVPGGLSATPAPPSYSSAIMPPAYSSYPGVQAVQGSAPSPMMRPGPGGDGTTLVSPAARDQDENAFVAPCGQCNELLPLPDGEWVQLRCGGVADGSRC